MQPRRCPRQTTHLPAAADSRGGRGLDFWANFLWREDLFVRRENSRDFYRNKYCFIEIKMLNWSMGLEDESEICEKSEIKIVGF